MRGTAEQCKTLLATITRTLFLSAPGADPPDAVIDALAQGQPGVVSFDAFLRWTLERIEALQVRELEAPPSDTPKQLQVAGGIRHFQELVRPWVSERIFR